MANGKKTGGKNFEPGKSGNPAGRPTVPAELRSAKKAFKQHFDEVALELLTMPFSELKALASEEVALRDKTESFRMAMARVLHKAIGMGDTSRLNFYLDRVIGSVKNQVELSGPDGEPLAPLVAMTSQELTVTLLAIQKQITKETTRCNSLPKQLPPSGSPPASSRRGSRGAS